MIFRDNLHSNGRLQLMDLRRHGSCEATAALASRLAEALDVRHQKE